MKRIVSRWISSSWKEIKGGLITSFLFVFHNKIYYICPQNCIYMEPKFKEIVRRDPNVDLTNKPINEWPVGDKIQSFMGGPLVVASKAVSFDKVWKAIKRFTSAFKNYDNKMTPMWPKAGMSKDSKQPFKYGGQIS